MTITELIERLEAIRAEEGELRVYTNSDYAFSCEPDIEVVVPEEAWRAKEVWL